MGPSVTKPRFKPVQCHEMPKGEVFKRAFDPKWANVSESHGMRVATHNPAWTPHSLVYLADKSGLHIWKALA